MRCSSKSKSLIATSARVAIAACLSVGAASAFGAARVWQNTGTDYNTGPNWSTSTVPSGSNVALFSAAAVTQPNLSASTSVAGLLFGGAGSFGYAITRTNSAVFTLTGADTTGSGGTTSPSAVPLRGENTSGTNTISVPIVLGAATGTQVFYQIAGGTLAVNGAVSNTNTINLSLKGGGTIKLNAANSFASISTDTNANTVVGLGDDLALGAGIFSIKISTTVQAEGGARTFANAFVLAGTTTIGGANPFTINGTVTSSGATARALTINNSATTTLAGPVYLAADNAAGSASRLTIGGTGSLVISGAITNNAATNTVASSLTVNTSGSVTLSGANNYSGTTFITNGLVRANSTNVTYGSLGSGVATVSTTGVLSGTGRVNGSVVVSSPILNDATAGGTITAGSGPTRLDSVGTLTTGAETWNGAGKYAFKMNSTAGDKNAQSGLRWDKLAMSALSVAATSGNKFVIAVINANGGSLSYINGQSFEIANVSGGSALTNTDLASLFTLDTSALGIANTNFSLTVDSAGSGETGNDLYLNFIGADQQSTPEPTTAALVGLSGVALLTRRGRSRRAAKFASFALWPGRDRSSGCSPDRRPSVR